MELGLFTLLLKVKNLKVSRSFYEKFGFFASTPEPSNKNWIVRKNGKTVIDLFQDMLEKNTLYFNPDRRFKEPISNFTDIRELYHNLKSQGVKFSKEVGFDSKTELQVLSCQILMEMRI